VATFPLDQRLDDRLRADNVLIALARQQGLLEWPDPVCVSPVLSHTCVRMLRAFAANGVSDKMEFNSNDVTMGYWLGTWCQCPE
jgi:hypothetical protein